MFGVETILSPVFSLFVLSFLDLILNSFCLSVCLSVCLSLSYDYDYHTFQNAQVHSTFSHTVMNNLHVAYFIHFSMFAHYANIENVAVPVLSSLQTSHATGVEIWGWSETKDRIPCHSNGT